MDFLSKINQLKKQIYETLTPLITNNYWLIELPYYPNVGDVLIWKGTVDFLKGFDVRCDYSASSSTFRTSKISENTIILLQGGGNFGDIWDAPQNFRRKIIKNYPNNRIIVLPQTVCYLDKAKLKYDAQLFKNHKKLIICVRDTESYKLLKHHFFTNTILLLPDMAFCINSDILNKYRERQSDNILFLKRNDKELNNSIKYLDYIDEKHIDVCDWPTIEKIPGSFRLLKFFLAFSQRIPLMFPELTDIYANYFFKTDIIKKGIQFISRYKKVYTTRLHTAILCCLLEVPFVFFDNSYGKNSSFFHTWFDDLEKVKFIYATEYNNPCI
jgi:pyruvyl transferase EpsO